MHGIECNMFVQGWKHFC